MKVCFIIQMILWMFLARELKADEVTIPAKFLKGTEGKIFLISIGINKYRDPFWPELSFAAQDAQRVAQEFGLNTKYKRIVKTILNNDANLSNINKALIEIAQEAKAEDTVILYLSGHGSLSQGANGELEKIAVLTDSRQSDLMSTGLRQSKLNHWLDSIRAKRKLMVFATCHSGIGKSKLPPQVKELLSQNKGKLVTFDEVSEGSLILAAATQGESAREDSKLQGDIYTHFLLEALQVYDRNDDGMVTALEAHDYAKDKTWTYTRGKQRPTAEVKFIGDADIPLRGKRNRDGLPVLEAYDENLANFKIKIDEGIKGTLPNAFPLGEYSSTVKLYGPNGNFIAAYEMETKPGDRLTLDEILASPPFSLGISLKNDIWDDKTYEQLTGSSRSQTPQIDFSYILKDWRLGLTMDYKNSGSGRISEGLNAKIGHSAFAATFHFQKNMVANVWLYTQLSLGQETMSIKLSDSYGNESNFSDASPFGQANIGIEYLWFQGTAIGLSYGYRKISWNFDTIGSLSGNRQHLTISAAYHFGSRARRIK